MNRSLTRFLFLAVIGYAAHATADPLTIATVPVGNPGNAGQVQIQGTFGAVAYNYRIGTYEVTNNQYAAFLNATATADPFGLFNDSMGSDPRGGITQSGASGTFSYATRANMGEKPVNFVSWYDSLRFANWLHNGQPIGAQGNGTTETGAYALVGGTTEPTNGLTITRDSSAKWFLPSEDEWYKAAYYNPETASYFTYPTSSDTGPAMATADADGDVSNPGPNVANFGRGADWDSDGDGTIEDGSLTTVGSAGAPSPYFTFDQGGNVMELTEALRDPAADFRIARGGSYPSTPVTTLRGFGRPVVGPTLEVSNVGFRVGTAVPEPSSLAVLAAALLLTSLRRPKQR
jgi:sulfatase modifying factor 1